MDEKTEISHNKIKRNLFEALRLAKIDGDVNLLKMGARNVLYKVELGSSEGFVVKMATPYLTPNLFYPRACAVLRREAKALELVNCEHVPSLQVADCSGRFLVRQFVEGATLEELSSSKASDLILRLIIAKKLIVASRAIFQCFHNSTLGSYAIRDFKPQNLVLRNGDNRVFLVDLGSVRSETAMLRKNLSPERIGSGRWRYWAPEQLFEEGPNLGSAVDYFALGSTLFATLFGSAPSQNLVSKGDWLDAYQGELAAAKNKLATERVIPRVLAQFIIDCLSPKANMRPTSIPSHLETWASEID